MASSVPSQTVLFTVVPRGVSLGGDTLPVSVVVSPRLVGPDRLDAYSDWVDWTQKLAGGAEFVFASGTQTANVAIDTAPLRPDLWRALFSPQTFVRSRKFDDYSSHGVLSFSVRESLSALKAVYKEASVVLALPDPEDQTDPNAPVDERHRTGLPPPPTNRDRLGEILSGLDVHWNRDVARRWRELTRRRSASGAGQRSLGGGLDQEGLILAARNPAAFQQIAGEFAAYHHMPTPTEEQAGPVTVDPDAFDFHQALSALEAHPGLQRALGLVLDFDLPLDLMPASPTGAVAMLSVSSTGIDWRLNPKSQALETACVHFAGGTGNWFAAASRTQTNDPGPLQVVGLLNLDPNRFGVAQVDVDGAMHKVIATAEICNNPDPGRSLLPVDPEPAPNPHIFDPGATLPTLRSGGLQLYADRRGATVIDQIGQSKAFNAALESGGSQPPPFYAEDLVRGYRLDVWDSRASDWYSLHRRSGAYAIGADQITFDVEEDEGFFQLAAVQPAPGAPTTDKDLYVHEVIARWGGWSLSAPFPGKALSRHGDPDKAVPPDGDDPDYRTDEPITAFKVQAQYKVTPRSLPRLRFGSRYRIRARAVDLAGNSVPLGHLADTLAQAMALPRDPEGLAYLRYEPVAAPLVVIRDEAAVTSPGSAVHRLVIRSFNDDQAKDGIAADLTGGDRHIVPPRTSVELGERMGMFDGPDGRLRQDAATWQLAADRDEGKFADATITIAGKTTDSVPIDPSPSIDALPYLPDQLSRGAAIRDLPGSTPPAVGRAGPSDPAAGPVGYERLTDVNARLGSATLVSFNSGSDWQQTTGFRLDLAEPVAGETDYRPRWDPAARVLTVLLPKGMTAVVPLSSYMTPSDLKLMGLWQWLREFVDLATIFGAQPAHLLPDQPVDRVAQVLQRAVEGGHWMLTPPTLLTLVHAVQQPVGRPAFAALDVEHSDSDSVYLAQRDRVRGRTDPQELAAITAARRLHETSAYLTGAIRIHGASTAKVELFAAWTDPVDDPAEPAPSERTFNAPVDQLPLPRPREGYLRAPGKDLRLVGYYDAENDQIALVLAGDRGARAAGAGLQFWQAAPRHELGDTRRHQVRYTAVATSRYREYFDPGLDFTRASEAVLVDVPASERPLAPRVLYVVPTFGWQRQNDTNMKRSVRFGGGLRVYMERGWYSSGVGELLGVALWNDANGPLNDVTRDKLKPFITQWGMDPIWQSGALGGVPDVSNFPGAAASDRGVSLEETSARISASEPGRVDVVGFEPQFDPERSLWFADLAVDLPAATYQPFVRLALVRYQPHALDDARISRVVLADFVQLTPDRTALVTADPHHPRTLRIVVSGVAPSGPPPSGPAPIKPIRPTHVSVRVQARPADGGELGWEDAAATDATVTQLYEGAALWQPDLGLWAGTVTFNAPPPPGAYRLLLEEFEYVSASYTEAGAAPGRLIYAETIAIDDALVGSPA